MDSKQQFISKSNVFQETVHSTPTVELLTTKDAQHQSHNIKANLLRNGLTVVSYSFLEEFIKTRIGEIIAKFDNRRIQFQALDADLQKALSLNALDGLRFRADMLKKKGGDWMSFIQDETKTISSSKNNRFKLSQYSIGWNKPNLESGDINKFLKLFGIKGGWQTVQKMTVKGNVTLPSPESIYKNSATRRHQAAHSANANSLLTDLQDFSKSSRIIAFAFDSLMSRALSETNSNNQRFLSRQDKLTEEDVLITFLIKDGIYWREKKVENGRTIKLYLNQDIAIKNIKKRSYFKNATLIVKDENNLILNWVHS